jgi:hypothetical protein
VQGIEGLTAKAGEAIAQRDAVAANLLELDSSFGKRLLAGAELTGHTKRRWESAETGLAELWETFTAYSAVIDRLAELTRASGPGQREELAPLLEGRPVRLTRAPAPLARRDLADTGGLDMSLAEAVTVMRVQFTAVAEVTTAAEEVWNELTGRLDPAAEQVAAARPLLDGLDDADLAAAADDAQARLEALRDQLNTDPLALWHEGRADTSAADRLRDQVAALAPRIAELDRLRREATGRIGDLRAAAEQARAARADAAASRSRAAVRITGVPPLPEAIPDPPLDTLAGLAAAGHWRRLATELAGWQAALAQAQTRTRDTERIAATLLGQRSELRGLLDAYRAKATRLGSGADPDLAERYERARDLLWSAPCDLTAATAAVTGYQQAILALRR